VSDLVLVTGATGKTGRNLVHQLDATGVAYRAASRGSDVPFDWTDRATWEPALAGVTAVYLVAPPTVPDPYARMIEFLELATRRDVGRFVFLGISSLPAGPLAHGQVHQWLQDNATDWTVLRPSAFMQNFSEGPFFESIRDEDTIYSNTAAGRVGFIDAQDIARAAHAALTAHVALNADFVLTGDESLSYDEVAEIIGAACERAITHTHITTDDLTERFVRRGIPELTAQLLAAAYETIASGSEDFTTSAVRDLTGRSPMPFRTFADAHASIWQRS
jgi:uncharacterized protein YbjT (DUF2867 family)